MGDNSALRRSRPSCLAAKRRYHAETERRSKKGRRGRRGPLLIWSLITEGPRGPQGLGTAILRRRVVRSLFLAVILLPRLLRVPCSELLITFACISPFFLLLARFSRHSAPWTISLLHALCIWRSRDSHGLCGRTGPSFPRKKSRIGFATPRTVTWASEKAWFTFKKNCKRDATMNEK